MNVSVNYAIIGSNNGLSPVRRHAIIWTNAGLLMTGPFGDKFQLHSSLNISVQENQIFNVVCDTAKILSRPQCFKFYRDIINVFTETSQV